ncbi:MAG TPA: AIR synthase-related protein, partial [Dehalococcoidia bacterium]|nr:AIR synthase-related protein [Dehalococcoidia bacterium]
LGEALLVPHRCYLHELRPLLPRITALAHITGGGLYDNVPRILPEGVAAEFDRSSWSVPSLFRFIQRVGDVPDAEMFRTFNMGVGMVIAAAPEQAAALLAALPEAWRAGHVIAATPDAPRVALR